MSLYIKRPCPKCKLLNCCELKENTISCQKCNFHLIYTCPICQSSLKDSVKKTDENGDYYECQNCNQTIHLQRILYLINNMMQISYDTRCQYCNGPTIYRVEANMGHRCLYFPKCCGQSSLFTAKKESLVFLDFETSGLQPGKDYIIEIGALKIDENGFEHTFDTFINIPLALPEKIKSITNISDDMLKDAPKITEVFQDFYDFIGDSTIVAHNAEFDILWLLVEAEKHNLKLPNNSIVCTYKWARAMKEARASLSALTKKYNIGHLNAHRALADASVTKELFFIYENQQTQPRPTQPLSDYETIQKKIQLKVN